MLEEGIDFDLSLDRAARKLVFRMYVEVGKIRIRSCEIELATAFRPKDFDQGDTETDECDGEKIYGGRHAESVVAAIIFENSRMLAFLLSDYQANIL